MNSSSPAPKVAVIGGQGIGRIHASLLSRLGCEVTAICCSSFETAQQCVVDLKKSFGIQTTPYFRIDDVLALELNGVSICTPPHMHFTHLLACLDKGVPVFCEKPLIWDESDSLESVIEKLALLRDHPKRSIFVNTSNTHFLDVAKNALKTGTPPQRFEFSFYTQGHYTYSDIAYDLFPHALSFVLKIFGKRDVANYSCQVDEHQYTCSFEYGNATVFFDLRENADGPKSLFFSLDGQQFARVQEGFGPTYRVFIENAEIGRVEAEDPFKVFMTKFIKYIRSGAPVKQDSFAVDAMNLEIMATLLLPPLHNNH